MGWRPTATQDALRLRARLLERTRRFFAARDVLEVETPLLARRGVTDLHLHSLTTRCAAVPGRLFLQTSPEYAMKRLLAAGSGDVFQICKAFRDGERGSRHNHEFTMLEWYRLGFDHHRLMDEVAELLTALLDPEGLAGATRPAALRYGPEHRTYRRLFEEALGLDPLHAPTAELIDAAGDDASAAGDDRDDLLSLLLVRDVEPRLPRDRLVFVHDYPPSQAALARLVPDERGDLVAARFEAYLNGLELANGFDELGDAAEQRQRFESDRRRRAERDLPDVEIDDRLLAALTAGLPACAGVAVGFDRVVMLAVGAETIADVLAFPIERA